MQKQSIFYKPIFIFLLAFCVFFISWLVIYKMGVNTLAIQSEDTIPALFLPIEILKTKSLYLDKYYPMMIERYPQPDDKKQERGLTPFYLKKVGIHYLSAFPIITPLLSLPVYIIPVYFNLPVTWDNLILLGHISGAFIVALSGVIFFSITTKHLQLENKKAYILTSIYLFGTINFSLLSQAMWQHGAVELFSLLAIYLLFEKRWLLMAFSLGFAVLARPTAGLIIPFLGLLVVQISLNDIFARTYETNAKKYLDILKTIFNIGFKFVLGIFLPFAFFFWYTEKFYLGVSNNGYATQFLSSWLSPFPQGWLGMWLSPSKGILIYSPVIVFALVGLWLVLRLGNWRKAENFKYIVFGCIFLVHTLVLSIWKHWYGGWGFGYRMASDTIPFMIFCIAPFLNSSFYEKSKACKKVFWITVVFSILVQIFGIIFFDGIWHAAYDRGFRDTAWLWSIQDSEFVFNIRRILVKFGFLVKACPQC
ncbi:hypothetical protein HYV31_04095 [candidate division WWE3 bacterium]|nr:hypothetical protein [candidate division WWE3 bacterium]